MSQPDPSRVLDGNLLHMWNQLTFEAGMRGADPPAGYGWQQGLAPALPDGSYVVAPQYFFQPSSGDDGVWVNNAIQQASVNSGFYQGCLVRLLPVTYNFAATTPLLGVGCKVIGTGDMSGTGGTIIDYAGSGDCFRQTTGQSAGYSSTATIGGGINNLTIDLTNASAGACGIHAGDIESLTYDRTYVRNATGTGSIGYHFDNSYNFTERLSGRIEAVNCTNSVVFDVTSNSGPSPDSSFPSFARPSLEIMISSGSPAHNGVVLQNGALVYNAPRFSISGNFGSAASGSGGGAVLTVTGAVPTGHPSAGQGSRMENGRLDIGVETPANTVTAQTINFGGSTNNISGTRGSIDFDSLAGTPFTSSNVVTANGIFHHYGDVFGDPVLGSYNGGGSTIARGAIGTGQTIFVRWGGTISVNPAAAVTGIILAAGLQDTDEVTIVNLSSNLVTFAAAATSNVAAGASATVPALTDRTFAWNAATSLWYGGV